jgi:hypothetical protein
MQRELAQIILDTNVLLDAAFESGSVSCRTIQALREDGNLLLLDRGREWRTEQEAFDKLAEKIVSLNLLFDPRDTLRHFNAEQRIRLVEAAPQDTQVPGVNKRDRPVARAALHYHAALLTNDAALVCQARKLEIEAVFPWTILPKIRPNTRDEDLFRIGPLYPEIGCIFARVTPGWGGATDIGCFTVFDVENLGLLQFDTHSQPWVFSSEQLGTVRLHHPEATQGQTVVCVTYSVENGKTHLVLRAGRQKSKGLIKPATVPNQLKRAPGGIKLGRWNGYIRHFTTGPHTLDGKTWKAMIALEDGAPNPLNHNLLDKKLMELNSIAALSHHA